MRRHGLRDDQWALIAPLLPGCVGHAGGAARDNRCFVEAVVPLPHRYALAGAPWAMPERFGESGLVIVGLAGKGTRCRDSWHAEPDMVVLDLHLPDLPVLAAARPLRERHPVVAILFLIGAEGPSQAAAFDNLPGKFGVDSTRTSLALRERLDDAL